MPASDLLVYTKNDYIYLNKKGALKVDKKKLKKEGNNNVNQNA